MRVALTGTPGTGKTAVAKVLQNEGYTLISLYTLAEEQGFFDGIDKQRNAKLLDVSKADRYIKKTISPNTLVIIEGLASHLLKNVEKIILLRCHPQVLQKRLQTKEWSQQKITENCEAEALDIILCEAVEIHEKQDIFEIDTTKKTINTVAANIKEIITSDFTPTKKYNIGTIDWSEEILKGL